MGFYPCRIVERSGDRAYNVEIDGLIQRKRTDQLRTQLEEKGYFNINYNTIQLLTHKDSELSHNTSVIDDTSDLSSTKYVRLWIYDISATYSDDPKRIKSPTELRINPKVFLCGPRSDIPVA
ncbi:hypothetical protein RF11_05154 [Thelohanellus kitauei]|uniref:Uncharacterized protein n=1 Tax=Thelohanellus kitauei TaxID=669202 RepID=A0A0C2MV18_THEKT|nr:hypothetical protein RF11_05154 [Thelohanellus kitauei]